MILWAISFLVLIISTTGFVGIIGIYLKLIEWDKSWHDKMFIINAIVFSIIFILFCIIGGTYCVHEILSNLI